VAQGGWSPPPGGYPPPPGGYGPAPGYGPPPGYEPPQAPGAAPPGGFAPAPAPPVAAPAAWSPPRLDSAQAKGFIRGLFDFSFETFIALKVMRVLYGFFLAALALGMLGMVGSAVSSMLNDQFLMGLALLIVLPFVAIVYLILGRVYFELIIVAFKIAEDADEIAKNTRR